MMKVFGVFALMLLVAVLVAGCSVQCGSPTSPGSESATSPSPTPTPSPPEPAAGPRVLSLTVGDEYKAEGQEVTHATLEFTPETKKIYVVAALTGLAAGDKVTGAMRAVDVTTKEGENIKDVEVASTDVESPGSEATVDFGFSAPDIGWPKGSYVVKISLGDKELETAEITVK